MHAAVVAAEVGPLGRRKVTHLTLEGLLAGVASLVVVESGSLSERFLAEITLVWLVSCMHSGVGLQRRRLPEGFATNLAAVGSHAVVTSHVGEHGSLLPESVFAHGTFERSLARMLTLVISQVQTGFEGFAADVAFEVADVLVVRLDVGLQATRLAEALVAVLAADLEADAVGAEMVAKGVAVGVDLITDVALIVLAFVGALVKPGRRSVVESGRTPVAKVLPVQVILVPRLVDVRRHRVPCYVQPQVTAEILTVGEPLETGEADESLGLVVVELLLGQGEPVLLGHRLVMVGVSLGSIQSVEMSTFLLFELSSPFFFPVPSFFVAAQQEISSLSSPLEGLLRVLVALARFRVAEEAVALQVVGGDPTA